MNFPFFHQVIVAGGRDPKLLHTKTTDLDTDNGSSGRTSCTDVGSTGNKRYFRLYYIIILSNMKFIKVMLLVFRSANLALWH